ncbi:uncharacterized protein B0P05DRAFT_445033, partial [Gilbertella persicaria]|uniref:uncharacterized protein n=1 Tax=Gilbertella persicaria TaxID=101096 RepID=UPI0022202D1A
MIPSLYAICLDYLKHHSELISSFENVPFQPIVYTVLEHVFTSTLPLNTNLLGAVSRFGHELRQLDTPWTRLVLSRAATGRSALPSLIATSQLCPQFITCLKLGSCGLRDQDLYRLKEFAHLQVLDVGHNPLITDRGVSYIVTMATLGIHGLQDLYLSHLPGVTDKSLKYVGQLESLVYLDLSKTDVTEQVATTYLTMQGF